MNNELIKRVEDKILETFLLAQRSFGKVFELPQLSFELNSSRVAGQAHLREWKIKINPEFLEQYPDKIISRTVPHEVAHLVAYKVYPYAKQHHGPEWKSVAVKLGTEPTRCHSMHLPSKQPHTYVCSCQKFHVSNLIHRKIQNGQRRFCPKCKKYLVYLSSVLLSNSIEFDGIKT